MLAQASDARADSDSAKTPKRPLSRPELAGKHAAHQLDVDRVDDLLRAGEPVRVERPPLGDHAQAGGDGRGDPRLRVLEGEDVSRAVRPPSSGSAFR